MKKVLWVGIAYGTLVLAQLIGSLLFSMLTISPAIKVLVLAALLIASGAMIPVSHALLKREKPAPEQLAVICTVHKQVTLLVAAGTFSLLTALLELFFIKAFVLQMVAALLIAAACVVSGIRIYRAVRPGLNEESLTETPDEDSQAMGSSQQEP